MTEAEWEAGAEPKPMLNFLRGKLSDRKLRLFAVACCRASFSYDLTYGDDEAARLLRRATEIADRLSDGAATEEDRRAIREMEDEPADGLPDAERVARACVDADAYRAAWKGSEWSASHYDEDMGDPDDDESEEMQELRAFFDERYYRQLRLHAALLREIAGTPFRPPPPALPAWVGWNGGFVCRLAQAAYDDRQLPDGALDPSRLAVLADALEDAGCTDRAILDHLRGAGPHVRGCWAVDLLTARL